MQRRHIVLSLPLIATLAACSPAEPPPQATAPAEPAKETGERPMDEVPRRTVLPNGDRQYGYRNGCLVVLEARRAVVKSEGEACQPHHRDISLLYASGD